MFEPEELMARIADLEGQLEFYEQQSNPANSPRANELIACLEGEIAKRDEELAACHVAVENCEVFRARIAELEAKTRTAMGVGGGSGNLFVYGDYDSIKAAQKIVIERDQLRAELSAIKAHGNYAPASVVWIDAHHVIEGNNPSFIKDVALVSAERTSETQIPLTRLNATPVQQVSVPDGWRDGYRAAMNSAASGARQLYVQHCHHHGVNGLLDRCKELEQSFIRDADASTSAAPAAPAADAGHVFYGMDGNHQ